jgi:hypothetical protein
MIGMVLAFNGNQVAYQAGFKILTLALGRFKKARALANKNLFPGFFN